MTDEQRPEAAIVRELAVASTVPRLVEVGDNSHIISIVVPESYEHKLINLEKFYDSPSRKRGTVELHDQASFARVAKEHTELATHLYADRETFRFVAVFNDASKSETGWADHRASLTLKHTPEWLHWIGKDNQLIGQVEFAEHIEDGVLEIHEPDAAYVLELAQTFHAQTNVTFRQAHTLQSGEKQFEYVENTTAGAGRAQDLTIPAELILGIAPFEGTQPYKVTARLRYRLSEGHLKLGYKLDRPHEVLRSAFNDAVQWIATDTSLVVLAGLPPTGV